MQALARQITPKLSAHRDNIMLNTALFARVKSIYERKKELNLNADQHRVVEKYYRDFERNGANLLAEQQVILSKLNNGIIKCFCLNSAKMYWPKPTKISK